MPEPGASSDPAPGGEPVVEQDVFSLSRARQALALLDRCPVGLRDGDVLPRGWHGAMFAPAFAPRACARTVMPGSGSLCRRPAYPG